MLRRVMGISLLAGLAACGGGGSASTSASTSPTSPTAPSVTVSSVSVSGASCTNGVCTGQVPGTRQLTATAQLSSGSTQDVTSQSSWTSSNANVASVSTAGLVTFVAGGSADVLAAYQGHQAGVTFNLTPSGPKTSFGDGTYQVGKDIAPGRYFAANVSSGCYWERDSGLGGTLNEIIANDFVGFAASQVVVDIAGGDVGFTSSSCGFWTQSPNGGTRGSITPGYWLVNTQITPGTYTANASSGCYWERLRDFSGVLGAIISNDFVSGSGQQVVSISGGDIGFDANSSCGTWSRSSSLAPQAFQMFMSPRSIETNWRLNRANRGGPAR